MKPISPNAYAILLVVAIVVIIIAAYVISGYAYTVYREENAPPKLADELTGCNLGHFESSNGSNFKFYVDCPMKSGVVQNYMQGDTSVSAHIIIDNKSTAINGEVTDLNCGYDVCIIEITK